MNLKCTLAAGGQVQVKAGIVAFLCSLKGFYAFRVLCQAAKAEVLEAYDTSILNTGEVHRVVPHVVVVLHPVVGTRAIDEAGISSAIILIGGQAEYLEAFAGHLGSCVFVAITCFCCPYIILSVGIIAGDSHPSAFGNGLLIAGDLHGSHHRLAGIAETAWRTMVEDIPLAVNFLQGTVSVVAEVSRDEFRAILVEHDAA